jgi:hypothetical protein
MELTLRPNRLRYLLFMTSSAGFVAGGALMVREGDPMGWAGILFFGAGVIVFCVLLLPGSAYLKLDPAGFTVCSLFRAHSTRWYEVNSFEVGRIGGRKLVVFNFSNLHRGQGFARKLSSAIGGYEGALPETYGLSAEDLAAMMNDWRQRGDASTVS